MGGSPVENSPSREQKLRKLLPNVRSPRNYGLWNVVVWIAMRVKRDNRSFRTRFTTVMISSFFFTVFVSSEYGSVQVVWWNGEKCARWSYITFRLPGLYCYFFFRTMPALQMFVLANCQLHVVDAFSILWSSSYLRLWNKLHLHLLMYTQSRINWQTNTTKKKPCLPCCRGSY